jgi:hypothetical protein
MAVQRPTTERFEPGTSHTDASLRGPTYRENSHANHTWHRRSREGACLWGRRRRPRGFDSHRPLHSQASSGNVGRQDWGQHVDPMGRSWESTPRGRGGGGLMASRDPALPLDSHVQSHAEALKNKLCEFPCCPVAREIAGGWTRPSAAGRQRPLPRRLVLRLGEPDSVPAAIRVFNDMRHNAKTC